MKINFKNVDKSNWKSICKLRVKDEQEYFVLDNKSILAKAFAYKEDNSIIYGIYLGENPIGLIMTRDYIENNIKYCILDQMMIDKNYQKNGYGKKALSYLVDMIKDLNRYDFISLCFIRGNQLAEGTYKKLGFSIDESIKDDEEEVMKYKLV